MYMYAYISCISIIRWRIAPVQKDRNDFVEFRHSPQFLDFAIEISKLLY